MKSVLSVLCSCERSNFKQSKPLFILIMNTESELTYDAKVMAQNIGPYFSMIEALFKKICNFTIS
jgi:hypothetical protein